jgi:hypothetical protein
MHIVDFSKCKMCKHLDEVDYKHPCNECLAEPVTCNSHTPIKFEKREDIGLKTIEKEE